jgi:phosphatidylcholine synthase
VLVLVPLKYIYPNRTVALRPLTLTLGIIWAVVTIAMLAMLPTVNTALLTASLSFIVYYLAASFILHARASLKLAR